LNIVRTGDKLRPLRRHLLRCLAALALLAATLVPALAAWPEKPIRLIVPSAAGGAPDVLMRALADQLSRQMGVPFVIDNKPGGSRPYRMRAPRRSPSLRKIQVRNRDFRRESPPRAKP
jgi:hypothetical protein